MNVSGFTPEAVESVYEMLYAERRNPYLGTCNQKKQRAMDKGPRTPAQQRADRNRSAANTGKNHIDPATRSRAAKAGAKTRSKCK